MTATILQLHRDRGTGSPRRRRRQDLPVPAATPFATAGFTISSEGAIVEFEPADPPGKLEAVRVRLVRLAPPPP